MPRYRFTGFHEIVLTGLQHGGNAELHRADADGEPVEHGQPAGSTVVARPGDEVTTSDRYPHALLVNVDSGEPDLDWVTVGEQGPELRTFPAGTVVHSAEETAAAVKAAKPRKPRAPRGPRAEKPTADPATSDTTTDPEGEE